MCGTPSAPISILRYVTVSSGSGSKISMDNSSAMPTAMPRGTAFQAYGKSSPCRQARGLALPCHSRRVRQVPDRGGRIPNIAALRAILRGRGNLHISQGCESGKSLRLCQPLYQGPLCVRILLALPILRIHRVIDLLRKKKTAPPSGTVRHRLALAPYTPQGSARHRAPRRLRANRPAQWSNCRRT